MVNREREARSIWFKLRKDLSCVLAALAFLIVLSLLEERFRILLQNLLPLEFIDTFFTLIHVSLGLTLSFFMAKLLARTVSAALGVLLPPLTPKPVLGGLNLLVKLASTVFFLLASLYVLSLRITGVASIVQWLGEALSGFVSTIIALVVALQLRDIFGNYLAWIIIKLTNLVEPGDYVSIGGDVLKCVSVGGSHVHFVSSMGEDVYVPNLRFLTDVFRKKFSRVTASYVELRFMVPYAVPYERVKVAVTQVINELSESNEGVRSYQLLIADLSNYGVVYELWIKPEHPVFPALFRSAAMLLLKKELGDLLATPTLIQLTEPNSGEGEVERGAS